MWFFGSARAFHLNTLPADTFGIPGTALPNAAPHAEQRRRRRSAENQQLPGADHLADQPEEQAVGLQRPAAEEPRLGDDRRRSIRATAGIVWTSPIYTTGSVKFLDRHQPDARRGRLLDQLRALQHLVPARHRPTAVHARVVHRRSTSRIRRGARSGTPVVSEQGMYPDRFAACWLRVVHHRRAQREGRPPGHLGHAIGSTAPPTATSAPSSTTASPLRADA